MWGRSIKLLNRSTENITAVLFVAMVLLVFLQIISRAVFSSSFPWTEEAARFLMIWVTFLGASFAFQYGAHISIEAFVSKLSQSAGKAVQVLGALACIAFFIVMIVKGIEIIDRAMIQRSPALGIPMGYVYLIIPISAIFMTINVIDVTLKSITTKSTEDQVVGEK
jgi:TRAP-type C4-dicarboxylate transport system permease small subunit